MDKATMIYDKVCEFMDEYDVGCVEDIYQRDSVNEASVDLVGELVAIMVEN